MAWIRMLRKHDFQPDAMPQVRIAYKAGHRYSVKSDWATQMEFLGVAERIAAPRSKHAPPSPPESPFNGADPKAFDHDDDGKPGGSKPRRPRARRARSGSDDGT